MSGVKSLADELREKPWPEHFARLIAIFLFSLSPELTFSLLVNYLIPALSLHLVAGAAAKVGLNQELKASEFFQKFVNCRIGSLAKVAF